MAAKALKIPKDRSSELFFDPNDLIVGFRKRGKAPSPPEKERARVLRVVVQAFGRVIDDRFFPRGSTITVGPARRSTFRLPTQELPKKHALIEYGGNGEIVLKLNKRFEGILQVNEKLRTIADLKGETSGALKVVNLEKGSRGYLEHGTLIFYFEEIPDPERVVPIPFYKSMSDPYLARWALISLALHLVLLLLIKIWPAAPTDLKPTELPAKFRRIIVEAKDIKPYKPMVLKPLRGSRGRVGKEGQGAKAAGKAGKRGKGVAGTKKKKAFSNRDLNKTGVLDFFSKKSGPGGALDSILAGGLTGTVDKSLGKTSPRYGLPGERKVREGKGLQGQGAGGGGLSTSIGRGLGTQGRGGGKTGTGLADFGTGDSQTAVSAIIDEEEVMIMGNIPKHIIAKIIRDHLGRIRYCYERQLVRQPKLGGKIVVRFVIGLQGRVTSVKIDQTTMGSPPVEQCIMQVVRGMPFPKPGGGLVEVIYPFLFRVAG